MRRRVPDRSIDRYRSIGCPKIRPLGRRSGLCTRALLSMAPPGPLTHSRVDVRNRPTKPQSVRLRSHHRTTDRLGGGRSVGRGSERGRPRIDPGLNVSEIRSVGRSVGGPSGDRSGVAGRGLDRCCAMSLRYQGAAKIRGGARGQTACFSRAFEPRARARARTRRACGAFRGFFFFFFLAWLLRAAKRGGRYGKRVETRRGSAQKSAVPRAI